MYAVSAEYAWDVEYAGEAVGGMVSVSRGCCCSSRPPPPGEAGGLPTRPHPSETSDAR